MTTRRVLVASAVATGLFLMSGTLLAQENQAQPNQEELQQYKQRTEALEKKVEQLERATRENAEPSEEKIQKVAEKLAKQAEKPSDVTISWKDGMVMETRDKAFKMHVGGRVQGDAAWISEDSDTRVYKIPTTGSTIGDQTDGTEFRRLRVQLDGTMFTNVFYKSEVDFAGGSVSLKSAYIGLQNTIPFATLTVGRMVEPMSLEELTSDNYNTFMERALPNAFYQPDYADGVQLSNSILNDRMTWAAGVFRQTNSGGVSKSEGGYNLDARVTGLPWYEEDGAHYLHLGGSVSERSPQPSVTYSSTPEMHLASTYVSTGALTADRALVLGGEAALVYGPFALQSEYVQSNVDRKDASGVSFNGAYVEASYFLTGEHRTYSKTAGTFGRTRPINNFGTDKDGNRTWGAWQVAARYSYIDLNDADVKGGELNDATFGVNWYLNPNVRFMCDYTRAMLDDNGAMNGGGTNELGVRFQIDF